MKSEQINIRLPKNLEKVAEQYAATYGFRNIQELIAEALREKIFFKPQYDESFSEKEIAMIDKLIEQSISKKKLKTEKELLRALR